MCPPMLKKIFKLTLSCKNLYDSQKKSLHGGFTVYVRYAAGCRGAGAGGDWCRMQPYSIKRGWWGLAYSSPPLSLWIGLFLCSWVLDSHYAGRRVTGGSWQSSSSPIAKNIGVESECICTVPWPAERVTLFRTACALSELYSAPHVILTIPSSPLRGNIAVAGCARRPVGGHGHWVGGNRSWWRGCQQGPWEAAPKEEPQNQMFPFVWLWMGGFVIDINLKTTEHCSI